MKLTLTNEQIEQIRAPLKRANLGFNQGHPGESDARQPVHTVYGGAQLFKHDTAARIGELALKAFDEYAPDAETFGRALGLPEDAGVRRRVHERVREKLRREAVEDFRIDFEDGYGIRPDEEEDRHVAAAAAELAQGMDKGTLPPFIGIRVKPYNEELAGRSIRTVDLFLTELLARTGGKLPRNFVITLAKITVPEQVTAFIRVLDALEPKLKLARGALKVELMVETPQSIFDADGRAALPRLVALCEGRCTGAHFGTYDYTALCGITAAHQHMAHLACDFAKDMMQVTLAGTGIFLSDGATNIMPVGPHKAAPGTSLTPAQREENRAVVHNAWKVAYDHTRHSLESAFYQGWDLHPAQLPVRYAAVYTFFIEGHGAASARLRNFIEKAAQATLVGDVFDDAATGQGLLNYFLRAINCGAITEEEARATGLTLEEIRGKSFLKILEKRRTAHKKHPEKP